MQFYQSEPAYVKFDYNIPRGASIGVYARRNALPTHTQYHFKEVLSGFNVRTTRAATHVSLEIFFFLLNLSIPSYSLRFSLKKYQIILLFNRGQMS